MACSISVSFIDSTCSHSVKQLLFSGKESRSICNGASQSGYICGVEEMVHQLIECCAGWNCANHDDLETTIWVYTLSSLLLWTNLFELWAALSWDSVGETGDASHFLERTIII